MQKSNEQMRWDLSEARTREHQRKMCGKCPLCMTFELADNRSRVGERREEDQLNRNEPRRQSETMKGTGPEDLRPTLRDVTKDLEAIEIL